MFPLVGLPPLSVSQDSTVTRHILESAESGSLVHLATGYFNLTEEYKATMIRNSKASYRLLMAHPTVSTELES